MKLFTPCVRGGGIAFALVLCGLLPAFAAEEVANPPVAAVSPSAAYVYRIVRGDELNFRFFYTPELNTVAVVRADGRVALPLIGELNVEGLTVAELTRLVTQRLEGSVKRIEVSINVQGPASQRVFVGGEVARPGVQPLLGPLTALQAVMAAEGFRETAQPREVVLIRRGEQGERKLVRLNLDAAVSGTDVAQDVLLQPYDVVVVPRSGIANLNLWIDQYVRRNLPISVGFSYTVGDNGTVR